MSLITLILPDTVQRRGMQSILDEFFPEVEYLTLTPKQTGTLGENDICITDTINYISHQDFFANFSGRCAVITGGTQHIGTELSNIQMIRGTDTFDVIIDSLGEFIHHIIPDTDEHEQEDKLSAREIQILTLVVSGSINKEIASELNISINTVLTHRRNITSKLGIRTVSGLTLYALMHGYIKG